MVSRRVVLVVSLAAATLLINSVNLYLKENSDEIFSRYAPNHRLLANSESVQRQPVHENSAATIDEQRHLSLSVKKPKGYLLSLYVLEQLTMSSAHYISLLNLAHSWKLIGVEPTICHSRMYGLPGIASMCHQQHNASSEWEATNSVEVEYSRIYNLSYLNRELKKCLDSESDVDTSHHQWCEETDPLSCRIIESLDNFIESSHREIVLVHFVRGIGGGASRMTFLPHDTVQSLEQGVTFPVDEPIVDCTLLARESGTISVVEHMFNKLAAEKSVFVVKRVICINTERTRYGIDATHLKNAIFQSLPNVSVVFTKWQNRGVIGRGRDILSKCKVSPIHHSGEVITASKRFLSTLNIQKPFLSVHLRLERLYQCEALIPGYTDCCVERLNSLLSKVLYKHRISKRNVLIIKDYGQYGTDSCTYKRKYVEHSICMNLTRQFFINLQQYGYSASEFLPAEFDSVPDNSGFISLVEAGAILSGSVLIAGGFGSYQGTIIKQFLGINDSSINFKHFDNEHRYGSSSKYNNLYRVCTCTPLKGHYEKLNRINLGSRSCEDLNST